jgi:hypothetical protein
VTSEPFSAGSACSFVAASSQLAALADHWLASAWWQAKPLLSAR